jgi:hypothetical protein
MPNKLRDMLRRDPFVNAAIPIYVVLCKDGTPHPGAPPKITYEEAQASTAFLDSFQICAPHRVQAYRPMR